MKSVVNIVTTSTNKVVECEEKPADTFRHGTWIVLTHIPWPLYQEYVGKPAQRLGNISLYIPSGPTFFSSENLSKMKGRPLANEEVVTISMVQQHPQITPQNIVQAYRKTGLRFSIPEVVVEEQKSPLEALIIHAYNKKLDYVPNIHETAALLGVPIGYVYGFNCACSFRPIARNIYLEYIQGYEDGATVMVELQRQKLLFE